MATYVNDLRLKEISTGDESGTWGTSTNTNLELIGEALGYATQQVFSSDADATTTVADGASDPARAMYFKITSAGSLTATRTCTIAPNTVSRVMFIENATTGSQSIAISQGSGANVTIATGKTAVVYLDGAGSGAAVVDAMAGVDPGVTDTLTEVLVAGNTSGGTNIELTTTDKVQFRDSAIYINSSADGQLDLVADTEIQIAATTVDLNGNLDVSGTALVTGVLTTTAATVHTNGITMPDNAKAIFGAGSDLQIYHDGSNSRLVDSGTGNFIIQAGQFRVNTADDAEAMIKADVDGSVQLYYDNAQKLATTATGIDVTGTAVTDGVTVAGNILLTTEGNELQFNTSSTPVNKIYSDDAYTSNGLTISADNGVALKSTNNYLLLDDTGTNEMVLNVDGGERMRVTSTGIDVTGSITATVTDNTEVLTLISTDADENSGPKLALTRNSASPADNDYVGLIAFNGQNSAAESIRMGMIRTQVLDVTDGTEDSTLTFYSRHGGTEVERIATTASGIQVTGDISNASGDLTIDVAGDIILDADGTQVYIKDGGTERFRFELDATPELVTTGGNFRIRNATSDADILFIGNDGGSTITALTLDMSAAGAATFNSTVRATGIGIGMVPTELLDIVSASGDARIRLDAPDGSDTEIKFFNAGAAVFTIGHDDATANFVIGGVNVDDPYVAVSTTGAFVTTPDAGAHAVFNEGSVDADFRVESNSNTHMLFVDAGNDRVGIGESSPDTPLHITTSGTGFAVTIESTSDSATSGPDISIFRNSPSPADQDDLGRIYFHGENDGGTKIEYSMIRASVNDVTAGTEDSSLQFYTYVGGAQADRLGLEAAETVFNESSHDVDFRVESNSHPHAIYMNGANGTTAFGSSTPQTAYNFIGVGGIYVNNGAQPSGDFMSIDAEGGAGATKMTFYRYDSSATTYENRFAIAGETAETVVNESGIDIDFRVEGDANTHALFVDASTDLVSVGSSGGYGTLQVVGDNAASEYRTFVVSGAADKTKGVAIAYDTTNDVGIITAVDAGTAWKPLRIANTGLTIDQGLVVNESSADADFRVESDTNANMLFVDASANFVALGNTVANPASGFSATGGVGYASGGGMQIANNSSGASLVLGQNFADNGSICDFRKQSTLVGSISVTGSATTYNTSSDQRLKENIVDAPDAGDLIDAIQVRQFDWIVDGEHQRYGMVAQELNAVAPEAVSAPENPDEMMGVDYSKLVPMLIKEIQSLRARVAHLES